MAFGAGRAEGGIGNRLSPDRRTGRIAARLIRLIDWLDGPDVNYDGPLSDRHGEIMRRLPFGDGLTPDRLPPLLEQAGFRDIELSSHATIAAAQRRRANLRNRLRTLVYNRFVLRARKPA